MGERRKGAPVRGKRGGADARRDVEFAAADHERGVDGFSERSANAIGFLSSAGAAHEYGEFVAAQTPSDRVLIAQGLVKSRSNLSQHFIASVVSERIVNVLKLIQVEQQQNACGLCRWRWRGRVNVGVDFRHEALPIQQSRQRIAVRQLP